MGELAALFSIEVAAIGSRSVQLSDDFSRDKKGWGE
jgi:hypothetical protein